MISGAVISDLALRELIPDYENQDCPIEAVVESDAVYYLSQTKATKFPFVPSIMSNHGNKVI